MSTLNDKNFTDGDILVVDDNKANLKLIADLLSEAGYEIQPATSGELALRSVQAKLPALILLDIKMPDIDGYEVCRRLKADEKTRSIPVIFITVLDDDKEKVMGFQAGAVDYICKPIRKEEMLARVRTHLALRNAQLDLLRSNTELSELNKEFTDEITERKQTEQNFRNSLDDSPLGIRIVTAEGELLYANKATLDIYGYSSFEELRNTPTKQRYTPESYVEHRRRAEDRKLGKPVPDNYEIGITRKDGEVRYLQVFRRKVTWSGETQFQAICQDITERKQLEQALAEERKRLDVTLRSTGDGVITTDMQGKVSLLNRVAEQLTGWTQDEANGEPLEKVFHIVDEHTRKLITNPVKTVLKTGRIVGLINHAVLVSRDGSECIIADSGAPIRDEHGNLFGVVLVFWDITEVRKLEEEIQKTEKLQSVGNLAGGIAHDFNNLLTGIMGNISLAKRHIEPGSKAEERLTEAEKAS